MAHIVACCLTTPSHYLNQCWLKIIAIHPNAISLKMCRICCNNYHLKLILSISQVPVSWMEVALIICTCDVAKPCNQRLICLIAQIYFNLSLFFLLYQAALYRLWAYGFVRQAYSHFPTWIIINILRPRQNDRHFPDKIFKHNILNENVGISVQISLKFISLGSIIQHWFR